MGSAFQRYLPIMLLSVFLLNFPAFARAADKDSANSIVITFKDGHQQTFSLADIARIEFKTPAFAAAKTSSVDLPSRKHYVGQWTVGDNAGHSFVFTLEDSGEAKNNVESGGHGTWTYENGEVHIAWDNGWHDIIRKVGMKYRKYAFEPGRSLDDAPTNEGFANKSNPEPA
ncbi:MAG TPA: hypothetical protein VGL89_01500 [Candidatus Koribacter sp.]|jgi:hypothetical protein